MLRIRLLTAAVMLVVVGWSLFGAPPSVWPMLVTGLMVWAAWEWAGLAQVSVVWQGSYAVAIVIIYRWGQNELWSQWLSEGAILFWILAVPWWLRGQWRVPGWVLLSVGMLVMLPTGWSLEVLQLRGNQVLLAVMAVLWVTDSAAYFTGKAWGRHKLAPSISPGKTWEGVAGGGVAVTVYGGLWWAWALNGGEGAMAVVLRQHQWTWFFMIWLLAVLGILGDLFESWVKRCAGVKDSGRGLPGHGGILDRIDALTATLPLAAWWLGGTWH